MVFGGLNCYSAIGFMHCGGATTKSRKIFGGDLEFGVQREEITMSRTHKPGVLSRRSLLQASAGLAGGALLPQAFTLPAFAVGDHPAIGTFPAGSQGDTVNIGAAVPRTGTYAVQGEDELKGWQLAVEHINNGDPLLKKIAPKADKGLLGKKVNLLSADSAAKPNQAVQEIQTFINQNKI